MSTTGIDTWAINLKDVGAIYPFQGSEGLLVIIGVISWIAWHFWQLRFEKETFEQEVKKFATQENLKKINDPG